MGQLGLGWQCVGVKTHSSLRVFWLPLVREVPHPEGIGAAVCLQDDRIIAPQPVILPRVLGDENGSSGLRGRVGDLWWREKGGGGGTSC